MKVRMKWLFFAACCLLTIFMANSLIQPNQQTVIAASDYSVDYTQNDWGSGATVSVTITNNGSSAINGWTLEWTFSGNQKITNMWNASFTQSGASVKLPMRPITRQYPQTAGKYLLDSTSPIVGQIPNPPSSN